MFTALHGLARRATLHIIVAAEGAQLRVTVQPKPTGSDAPIPPALSLLASPEEFDRDFAATVAQYEAPATSLLEQGKAAAAAVAKSGEKSAEKSADKKPTKKAPATKVKTAKPADKPRAAEKPAAQKPEKKDKPAKPAPTKDSSAAATDRDALIELAREYLATLPAGEKPTRAGFIKRHKAGRRYERVFGNIEELFVAAQPATGGAISTAETPTAARENETILSPSQLEQLGIATTTKDYDPDSADDAIREAHVNESTPADEALLTVHLTTASKPAETVDGGGSPAAPQSASEDNQPCMPALSLI